MNIETLEAPLQATVRNRYGTNFEEVWLVEKAISKTTGVWYKSNVTVNYLHDVVEVWFKEGELEFDDYED